MELNREQIIKALGYCKSPKLTKCNGCPREEEDGHCMYRLNEDALSLIKELTEEVESLEQCLEHEHASFMETFGEFDDKCKRLAEENERLRELGTTKEIEKEIVRRETRADTVRKMQEQIKAEIDCFDKRGGSAFINKSIVFWFIDQIAKEMLEGEK